jgi:hypothetical protein
VTPQSALKDKNLAVLCSVHPQSDIRQKHSTSRITATAGRDGPRKSSDEGETEITNAVVNNIDEIRELTSDELDEAGGGLSNGAWIAIGRYLRCRRSCRIRGSRSDCVSVIYRRSSV